MGYEKPWISISSQLNLLKSRGVLIQNDDLALELLKNVGYYRLTGYLFPFREKYEPSSVSAHSNSEQTKYRTGTTINAAADLIEFDRQLRMLVMAGIEPIELALRARLAHVLGERSRFAHLEEEHFTRSFVTPHLKNQSSESKHREWLEKLERRRDGSDESFVVHFRQKYNNEMPVWAVVEILELGQLAQLYSGLRRELAQEVISDLGVPSKKHFQSWIASLNYVRNVSAHQARLFNRKMVQFPRKPTIGFIDKLDHLHDLEGVKPFGVYSCLAVMAFINSTLNPKSDWAPNLGEHLRAFPDSCAPLTVETLGAKPGWLNLPLWNSAL